MQIDDADESYPNDSSTGTDELIVSTPGGLKRKQSSSSCVALSVVEPTPKRVATGHEQQSCVTANGATAIPQFVDDLFAQDGCDVKALILHEYEWMALVAPSCQCKSILRSFQRKECGGFIVAVLRRSSGYVVVGALGINDCASKADDFARRSWQRWQAMYNVEFLEGMKNQKVFEWTISEIEVFPTETAVNFTGQRPKNRPFVLSPSMIKADIAKPPGHQSLSETARYFSEMLTPPFQLLLQKAMKAADNKTIRIGTTCSGSDICVTAFKEMINMLNKKYDKNVQVAHIFSCELDTVKRDLIMQQHKDMHHCFDDVSVFERGEGYCYVCKRKHTTRKHLLSIDFHWAGPSCKDVSTLNTNRSQSASCYSDPNAGGTSGPTYQYGVKTVSLSALRMFCWIIHYNYK